MLLAGLGSRGGPGAQFAVPGIADRDAATWRRQREPGHNREHMNLILRIVLLFWVLGYLLAACGPLLGGHLLIGTLAFAGGVLFFPIWVIGICVLGALVWVTNPPRG